MFQFLRSSIEIESTSLKVSGNELAPKCFKSNLCPRPEYLSPESMTGSESSLLEANWSNLS